MAMRCGTDASDIMILTKSRRLHPRRADVILADQTLLKQI